MAYVTRFGEENVSSTVVTLVLCAVWYKHYLFFNRNVFNDIDVLIIPCSHEIRKHNTSSNNIRTTLIKTVITIGIII